MSRTAPLDETSLPEAAAFVAALQRDPANHIGYLGDEPDAVAAELAALEPDGVGGGVVVRGSEGGLIGLLSAEWDRDPPRVWWHGPFVREPPGWDELADELLAAGRALLPEAVTQQEFAPDARNTRVAAFAERHGFVREVASAVLSVALDDVRDRRPTTAELRVRPVDASHRDVVASLHDRLFANTHTPGARVIDGDDRVVLVAERAGVVVGYVAADRQADAEGYLDYLGVTPSAQGRGIGGVLVQAVCSILADRGCSRVHLTVREDNAAARRLYERLGFTEQRLLVPWRLGFSGG